jgi:3'-5' exoribonuclease
MKSPATTFSHHSYAGGLLKHTLNVLKISLYLNGLYENTNRDLLICGAILHDIGKIEEFKITTSIKETKKSVLLGHEILGIHIIQNVINELDISTELTNKLYHIVSKHHTEAKFIEAKIIKHANELDSEVDLMIKLKEWGKEKTNHFSIQTEDFGELYLE